MKTILFTICFLTSFTLNAQEINSDWSYQLGDIRQGFSASNSLNLNIPELGLDRLWYYGHATILNTFTITTFVEPEILLHEDKFPDATIASSEEDIEVNSQVFFKATDESIFLLGSVLELNNQTIINRYIDDSNIVINFPMAFGDSIHSEILFYKEVDGIAEDTIAYTQTIVLRVQEKLQHQRVLLIIAYYSPDMYMMRMEM